MHVRSPATRGCRHCSREAVSMTCQFLPCAHRCTRASHRWRLTESISCRMLQHFTTQCFTSPMRHRRQCLPEAAGWVLGGGRHSAQKQAQKQGRSCWLAPAETAVLPAGLNTRRASLRLSPWRSVLPPHRPIRQRLCLPPRVLLCRHFGSHRRLHVPSNILLLPSQTSAARLRQPCCPLVLTTCEPSRSRLCCVHGGCDSTHTRQLPVLQLLTSMQRRSVLGSGGRRGCRWLLQCGGRKQGKRGASVALSGAPAAAGRRAAAPRPAAGGRTAPPAASPPCAAHRRYRV